MFKLKNEENKKIWLGEKNAEKYLKAEWMLIKLNRKRSREEREREKKSHKMK